MPRGRKPKQQCQSPAAPAVTSWEGTATPTGSAPDYSECEPHLPADDVSPTAAGRPPARCFRDVTLPPDVTSEDVIRLAMTMPGSPKDRPDIARPTGDSITSFLNEFKSVCRQVFERSEIQQIQHHTGLTDEEVCALASYSMEKPYPLCKWVNAWLTSGQRDNGDLQTHIGPYFVMLYRAMEKLPAKVCSVITRAVRVDTTVAGRLSHAYDNYRQVFAVGQNANFCGLAFTTDDAQASQPAAGAGASIIFRCPRMKCVSLEPFSAFPKGAEVQPIPLSTFRVKSVHKLVDAVVVTWQQAHTPIAYVDPLTPANGPPSARDALVEFRNASMRMMGANDDSVAYVPPLREHDTETVPALEHILSLLGAAETTHLRGSAPADAGNVLVLVRLSDVPQDARGYGVHNTPSPSPDRARSVSLQSREVPARLPNFEGALRGHAVLREVGPCGGHGIVRVPFRRSGSFLDMPIPLPSVDSLKEGDIVCRNPLHWQFGGQDGIAEPTNVCAKGVVKESKDKRVKVEWDNGGTMTYRYGSKDVYYDVVRVPQANDEVIRNPTFWGRDGKLDKNGEISGKVIKTSSTTATVRWGTETVTHRFDSFLQEVQVKGARPVMPQTLVQAPVDNEFTASDDDDDGAATAATPLLTPFMSTPVSVPPFVTRRPDTTMLLDLPRELNEMLSKLEALTGSSDPTDEVIARRDDLRQQAWQLADDHAERVAVFKEMLAGTFSDAHRDPTSLPSRFYRLIVEPRNIAPNTHAAERFTMTLIETHKKALQAFTGAKQHLLVARYVAEKVVVAERLGACKEKLLSVQRHLRRVHKTIYCHFPEHRRHLTWYSPVHEISTNMAGFSLASFDIIKIVASHHEVFIARFIDAPDFIDAPEPVVLKQFTAVNIHSFRREIRTAVAICSPFIVEVLGTFGDRGYAYVVMPWYRGGTLGDWHLKQDSNAVIRALVEVAYALSAVHGKGYVHRDVKLENVLLTNASNTGRVKLIDFEFSKRGDADALALSWSQSGLQEDRRYEAPEVAEALSAHGTRTMLWNEATKLQLAQLFSSPALDIYSFGKCVETVAERCEARRGALVSLAREMTASNPNKRPKIDEVKARLLYILADSQRSLEVADLGRCSCRNNSSAVAKCNGEPGHRVCATCLQLEVARRLRQERCGNDHDVLSNIRCVRCEKESQRGVFSSAVIIPYLNGECFDAICAVYERRRSLLQPTKTKLPSLQEAINCVQQLLNVRCSKCNGCVVLEDAGLCVAFDCECGVKVCSYCGVENPTSNHLIAHDIGADWPQTGRTYDDSLAFRSDLRREAIEAYLEESGLPVTTRNAVYAAFLPTERPQLQMEALASGDTESLVPDGAQQYSIHTEGITDFVFRDAMNRTDPVDTSGEAVQ